LIHDTFVAVAASGKQAIIQRLNREVFPRPELLSRNLLALTSHLKALERQGAEELPLVPGPIMTKHGNAHHLDGSGHWWRAFRFIPHTFSIAAVTNRSQAQEAGCVLGRFHRATETMPPEHLTPAIPGFHDSPAYLGELSRRAESFGPLPDAAGRLYQEILAFRPLFAVLDRARKAGAVHDRVIHGDPKIDNILFRVEDGSGCGLVDLDTLMPGLVHYDLADAVRSCCNSAGEESAGRRPSFHLDFFAAWCKGYRTGRKQRLSPEERRLVADAVLLLPLELACRFLADHLAGNRYFKVSHLGENLARAEQQLTLAHSIAAERSSIARIVEETL